jgi:hypothetical protein
MTRSRVRRSLGKERCYVWWVLSLSSPIVRPTLTAKQWAAPHNLQSWDEMKGRYDMLNHQVVQQHSEPPLASSFLVRVEHIGGHHTPTKHKTFFITLRHLLGHFLCQSRREKSSAVEGEVKSTAQPRAAGPPRASSLTIWSMYIYDIHLSGL